jgi:hypothetical protein
MFFNISDLQQISFFFLLLSDNETIAVNKTFDGDTEEGFVEDVVFTGAGGRGTHRSAAGQSQSNSGNSGDNDKLFHFYSFGILFLKLRKRSVIRKSDIPTEVGYASKSPVGIRKQIGKIIWQL